MKVLALWLRCVLLSGFDVVVFGHHHKSCEIQYSSHFLSSTVSAYDPRDDKATTIAYHSIWYNYER